MRVCVRVCVCVTLLPRFFGMLHLQTFRCLPSGHHQRVSGSVQQAPGRGPDGVAAREGVVRQPAVALRRLRGAACVRRVPQDQRQDQPARRRAPRVSSFCTQSFRIQHSFLFAVIAPMGHPVRVSGVPGAIVLIVTCGLHSDFHTQTHWPHAQ